MSMPVTKQELDSFHNFAVEKVNKGGSDLTILQLFEQWQVDKKRKDVNAAIREGLADIEAGNYRPLDEFMEEFREKHPKSNDY